MEIPELHLDDDFLACLGNADGMEKKKRKRPVKTTGHLLTLSVSRARTCKKMMAKYLKMADDYRIRLADEESEIHQLKARLVA